MYWYLQEHTTQLCTDVQKRIDYIFPRQTECVLCFKTCVKRAGIHWYMVNYWCVYTFSHWIIDKNTDKQHDLSPSLYFLTSLNCRERNRLHIVLLCDLLGPVVECFFFCRKWLIFFLVPSDEDKHMCLEYQAGRYTCS